MTSHFVVALVVSAVITAADDGNRGSRALPAVAAGWSIDLVAQPPQVLYPTAIVAAPDGTLYVGSDPMDMPGPPTTPIDRVLAFKNGQSRVFADKLWSVMGLEWVDDTLYVVHAPYLSAFRDTNGDGTADSRIDLITGLGPPLPGFNGINDHVASGIRLGMDGFLYIAVGDKGIPRGVGRDGKSIQLQGGGVVRVRRDGSGLEVVSTGERNPLSVALSATDEVFTYGNDDDSKRWPNSLTHHIVGGHYGYPYQFLTAPDRALPIMAGQVGGSGAQGICYNEDGLPAEYQGNLFFCDWGLQTVARFEIKKAGGTFALTRRSDLVTKGNVADFRPFSLAVANDSRVLWLVDWAYNGWLDGRARTGRLYKLRYTGPNQVVSAPRPFGDSPEARLKALDHPALAVRLRSQRALERRGAAVVPLLIERLMARDPEPGRIHALWALDSLGGDAARRAIASLLVDPSPRVRQQAARSVGIRGDRAALAELLPLLTDRDPAVRREAAIAAGRLGDPTAAQALYAALGDADTFAAWSVRQAIRRLEAWNKASLVEALLDDRRLESALRLTDQAWAVPVVAALTEAFTRTGSAAVKGRIVANLAGLYRRYPEWSGQWFGTNPVAGQFPRTTLDWAPEGMRGVQAGLALALTDAASAVRFQAIVGLSGLGQAAAPLLRATLVKEPDPLNQALLVEALGALADPLAVPLLTVIVGEPARTEPVRAAAIRGLARSRDPASVRARFKLLYDPAAPATLKARVLPDLARAGLLPPNDLASFLEDAAPSIRAAALLSLNVKKALPADLQLAVLDRLSDSAPEVREAAMAAIVPLQLRAAIPRLLAIAADSHSPDRTAAMEALCGIPDPRALSVYLEAIQDRDPHLRRSGETALVAIRDKVRGPLMSRLATAAVSDPARLTIERAVARFEPVRSWRAIGPFPRTTAPMFVGELAIDFGRAHSGVLGQSVSWAVRAADPATGRVDLSDLKRGAGDQGGFGYDGNGSPDLCAFAYTELIADHAGPALLLVGSSGTLIVHVNDQAVYTYANLAGRDFAPDTDVARIELAQGKNRIVVLCRQGIGPWCFSLQVARAQPGGDGVHRGVAGSVNTLREHALAHDGDPQRGEALFFDARGIGCGRCHAAAGRGTATIGPDLTGLAAKFDRAEVIRSVLEPSSRIATGYQPVVVATRDGKVTSGVVRSETETMLELADAEARITKVPKSDIDVRRVGEVSIMPSKLVEALSPAEFADLVSYLLSLKQPQAAGSSQDRR